jgi:hypothetical protein
MHKIFRHKDNSNFSKNWDDATGGNDVGYRNYWNSVFSIAVQTGVSNKILQWKYRKVQKENYFSTGGYPIGDDELSTELGGYQNNKMGSVGR